MGVAALDFLMNSIFLLPASQQHTLLLSTFSKQTLLNMPVYLLYSHSYCHGCCCAAHVKAILTLPTMAVATDDDDDENNENKFI